MTTRAIDRVDQWETRSFTGGYRGVHDLADREFSGVVRAGTATLCMLNGAVVGVLDGTIEDFEDAEGTAHVAPTPALPLLIVMQERSDEVRAKYYTEDTPLSKVDGTLSEGGFTGFVELSENVLSGDYYVVYHGGRSMSVAFVGERGERLTEEEAFERADDEVGIYEVRPVDVDVIDVPEPQPEPESTPSNVAGGASTDADATGETDATSAAEATRDEQAADASDAVADAGGNADTDDEPGQATDVDETLDGETVLDDETGAASGTGSDTDSIDTDENVARETDDSAIGNTSESGTPNSGVTDRDVAADRHSSSGDRESGRSADGSTEPTAEDDSETARTATAESTRADASGEPRSSAGEERSTRSSATDSPATRNDRVGESQTNARSRDHPAAPTETRTRPASTPATGSASDLETRTIPSLDPAQSWGADENGSQASTPPVPPVDTGRSATSDQPSSDERRDRAQSGSHSSSEGQVEKSTTGPQSESTDRNETTGSNAESTRETTTERSTPEADDRLQELQAVIDERESRIEDLEERVETTEAKRDRLKGERDDLEAERDELREELSEVRAELESLRDERDGLQAQLEQLDVDAEGVQRRLSRREAIDGTNLFVRYDSKSAPTLSAARESGASQSDVRENLSVEYHTQFEVEGTHVEGEPFEAFLERTIEHQYVSWVVQKLLFEIRDTGHREALADLYDALPHIDRVELNGSVGVEFTEDGQTKRSQESFDVVFRDRMGNPLIVANMNDSRQAATENQMNSLVTAATRVGETSDSLAGAMFVTSSFFEPAALETTADATGGGLLSRDKRQSYVKLSRKQGYHLCLVEARDDQFHMAVPEL